MQSIAEWLERLGLGQYAQRFAENGIDVSVLQDLTDQDLREVGVLLGSRPRSQRCFGCRNGTLGTRPSQLGKMMPSVGG
jgi:SAM domain (Sterile alpha motif)